MTTSVNRVHNFAAIQQTGSSTDDQRVNRIHNFAAIQQTGSTTDNQKVSRVHVFAIIYVPPPPPAVAMRKSLSPIGGRTGARQAVRW